MNEKPQIDLSRVNCIYHIWLRSQFRRFLGHTAYTFKIILGVSHVSIFHTPCIVMTQIILPRIPNICINSRFFYKIDSFCKKYFKYLRQEKSQITSLKNCSIYIQLLVSFFSLSLWIPRKNRAKQKNLSNLKSRLRWGTQYTRYTEYTYYLFISNCSNAGNFLIQFNFDNFYFIHDCRNSLIWRLKKLINEQIFVFCNPSNSLCSSDKSVQIKHFKHHTLFGMCSLSLGSICKY